MIYGFHDFTLDQDRHELRRAGQVVPVEPKTFQVLLYLLQQHDRVVTKDELLEQCWPGMFVSEAALTRCLAKIRQAVQPGSAGPLVIQTVHRLGCRFVATVVEQPDAVALATVVMPPALPAPEPLSLLVQGASEALEPDMSAAVPSVASLPSTLISPADLIVLVCSQCQATNRAARQFCAGCGHELWQPCPRCGFRNSPTEHFCGGCGQAMAAIVSVPTTARTGPPRAYTPAHLAARIRPGQPGLVGERSWSRSSPSVSRGSGRYARHTTQMRWTRC